MRSFFAQFAVRPWGDPAGMRRVMRPERGKGEAELVVGGVQYGETGCYMEPTVFLNPKPDAEIYRTEVFGPVAVVKTFETEEEVLKLANDTEYGLMSGVIFKENLAKKFGGAMKLFFEYSELNEVKGSPSVFVNNIALGNSTVHTSRPSYYQVQVYDIIRRKDLKE